MPLVVSNNKQIFFAHVPKTGGSSVEDYLLRRFGEMTLVDKHKKDGVGGTGLLTPITHLSALDLEEILPASIDYKFAVVREPLDRIMSEYRYQFGVSRASKFGFSTWLRAVLKAAAAEPRIYENHIRPQADLIPEGSEIFRLEDGLEKMVVRLDEVTGATTPDIAPDHLNKRPKQAMAPSREDAVLIAEFYAADYEAFGYATPDPAQYAPDALAGLRGLAAAALAPGILRAQRRGWVR